MRARVNAVEGNHAASPSRSSNRARPPSRGARAGSTCGGGMNHTALGVGRICQPSRWIMWWQKLQSMAPFERSVGPVSRSHQSMWCASTWAMFWPHEAQPWRGATDRGPRRHRTGPCLAKRRDIALERGQCGRRGCHAQRRMHRLRESRGLFHASILHPTTDIRSRQKPLMISHSACGAICESCPVEEESPPHGIGHRIDQSSSRSTVVRSLGVSPVLTTPCGSTRIAATSPSAFGQCSTPRGTT